MKRILVIAAALTLMSSAAFAFGAREHSAITIIADKYLTSKARAAISEISGGERIALFASHPDKFRAYYLYDGKTFSHTFKIGEDLEPLSFNPNESALGGVELAAKALKNYKTTAVPDSNVIYLAYLVHFVGDMHCPSHVKYPAETQPASPKTYVLGDQVIQFHKAWDSGFAAYAFNGGPMDVAYLADIATPKQIKEYQKGSVKDWAVDNAHYCFSFTRDVEFDSEGVAKIDNSYAQKHAEFAKNQVMKAGYRLAAILNQIFE